jgi:hypothetical protein
VCYSKSKSARLTRSQHDRAQDGGRDTSLEKRDANTALHTRRDKTFGADEPAGVAAGSRLRQDLPASRR